jgi:hypothetical protein
MKPIIAGLILGAVSTAPIAVEPAHISPDSHISLGVSITIAVFVSGLVWWLGRRLQQQDDMSNSHYAELTKRLDNLPCRPNGYSVECPLCKQVKRKRKR